AWGDLFETWRRDVGKKTEAGQRVDLELIEGRALVAETAKRSKNKRLKSALKTFDTADYDGQLEVLRSDAVREAMAANPDRSRSATYDKTLEVFVDRVRARYGAWYEMFPRSQGTVPGRSATFREAEARLPEIADMGFDVVYLTPIHPIGTAHRKGRNNALTAAPEDPGSPYAIGSEDGGHMAVHPDLGTLEDFRHFVRATNDLGMEVALDIAIQCSPDHPYVTEHPEWFEFRPDGSMKYAENPPKKYQDIVNVDFHSKDWEALWKEWRNVLLFWVDQGVKTFRVDNPHTKPAAFWEWVIGEVHEEHPDVVFLSEAFTRPRVLEHLAKIGFSQSYTYFTWRETKAEFTEYLTELTQGEPAEYLRPNFFPNTHDILPHILQFGGRPAFKMRLALAATLSSTYGIYSGYELCENAPRGERGTTVYYQDSEVYEYKVWDWDRPGNIKDYVRKINAIRRENSALHELTNLAFHDADDAYVLFYSKVLDGEAVLVAVNLDPYATHAAHLTLPLEGMGVRENEEYVLEELISGREVPGRGRRFWVRISPEEPAEIFRVKKRTPR
ncbi:MAG: maltotransferase domain-containing protein, partial [Rubrobacteraceae bacterium]